MCITRMCVFIQRQKETEALFLGRLQIGVFTGYPGNTGDVGGGFLEGFPLLSIFSRLRQGENEIDGLLVKIARNTYEIQVYLDKTDRF